MRHVTNSMGSCTGRLLRHMAAMGYITEVAADEYMPTNFTTSPLWVMGTHACKRGPTARYSPVCGLVKNAANYCNPGLHTPRSGTCLSALASLPSWLAEHQWQTPSDISNGPYQAAFNTSLNFFSKPTPPTA